MSTNGHNMSFMRIDAKNVVGVLLQADNCWTEVEPGTFQLDVFQLSDGEHSLYFNIGQGFTFVEGDCNHVPREDRNVSGPLTSIMAVRHRVL